MTAPDSLEFWTVGHSTRPVEGLLDLLTGHRIDLVIDVRQYPMSRRNPQFNRDTLAATLATAKIDYRHEGALGGRRKPLPDSANTGWQNAGFRGYADHMQTAEFRAAIAAVETLAPEVRGAFMCAEAVPWRCHRSLIADALTARGHGVLHIMTGDRADPHRMTPFARVHGTSVTYPALLP